MKKIIFIFFVAFLTININGVAQNKNIDTASFTVDGICGMCQERIENAAYIKGVKKVSWNKEEQLLTVIYKPKKVTIKEVAQSVADAGHDNEYFKATDWAYDNKVHHCCKYRENEIH